MIQDYDELFEKLKLARTDDEFETALAEVLNTMKEGAARRGEEFNENWIEMLLRQVRDPCSPIRIGGLVIGHVAAVNGDDSVQTSVPISRYEARLLVRHWMERDDEIHRGWAWDYGVSSSETRTSCYANKRIVELRDAGLVTQEELAEIDRSVEAAHAEEWQRIREYQKNRDEQSEEHSESTP